MKAFRLGLLLAITFTAAPVLSADQTQAAELGVMQPSEVLLAERKQCSRDETTLPAKHNYFYCDRQCRWHLDASTPAPGTGSIPGAFFDMCIQGYRSVHSASECKCENVKTGIQLGSVPYETPYIFVGPPPLNYTFTNSKPFTPTSFGGVTNSGQVYATEWVCALNISRAGATPVSMKLPPAVHKACMAPDNDTDALKRCKAGQAAIEGNKRHMRILHCGVCAACSDVSDLDVVWRTHVNQSHYIAQCEKPFIEGNQTLGSYKACLTSVGMNFSTDGRTWEKPGNKPSCMDAWLADFLNDYSVCTYDKACTSDPADEKQTHTQTPHTPAFEDSSCQQCDEYRSGPTFIRGAGMDRRAAGMDRSEFGAAFMDGTKWSLPLCKVGYYYGIKARDAIPSLRV